MAAEQAKYTETIDHCAHLLKTLTTNSAGPNLWRESELKTIRECVLYIKARPEEFPPIHGDHMPDGSSFSGDGGKDGNIPALTADYITSIAEFRDLDFEQYPILQVIAKPNFHLEKNAHRSNSSHTHFTHLRLRDGSNDVMTGRLSMHLAHDGKRLKAGDIIQLHVFTPLTFKDSGEDKPYRSPAVVVHTYSKVGYAVVPRELKSPKHCAEMEKGAAAGDESQNNFQREEREASVGNDEQWEHLEEVECTPGNRRCSLYGVSTVVCICESDPVNKIDLEVVREFCWFATTDVSKMSNSWKRNMLFWHYMTNTYNICGKGYRKEPPACLKYAIQSAYPEAEGRYKKYQPGQNMSSARKSRKRS